MSCVRYAPDGGLLATANFGEAVQLWDPETGEHHGSVPGHEIFGARAVAFSPDGRLLASTSTDMRGGEKGPIQLWDVASRAKLAEVVDEEAGAGDAAFSPDGKTLATAGGKTVKLWDVVTEPKPWPTDSAFSQARRRPGVAPLRHLFHETASGWTA